MFHIRRSLIILMAMGIWAEAFPTGSPTVYIGGSIITGKRVRRSQVNQYLGIPYAQPPIGELRFMPTRPLEYFPRVLKAWTQPPACLQFLRPGLADNAQSEDCLYLNIWTPADASPSNTKAVMFWIFGGSFQFGSIREDLYNGEDLAALGGIVVVTVSYRLGPMGFLTSNTARAPGNAGLWDVLEGLKWVHKNIKAFGGDPNRITIAGESAGSISVGLLSVSPLSRGLFRRQIMESGSPTFLMFENRNRNLKISEDVSSHVGCSNGTYTLKDHPKQVVECLQKVDAAIFVQINHQTRVVSPELFSPQYGDDILPFNPRQAIMSGNFHSTETLIGVNKDEGTILAGFFPEVFGLAGEKEPHLNKTAARGLLRMLLNEIPDPEPLVNYYLPDTLPENAMEAILKRILQAYGDGLLLCPTLYHAEKVADMQKNVYFYYWVHRSSTSVAHPRLGIPHFEEVQFVFGVPLRKPQGYDGADFQISQQAIGLWSNFVKYGYPSVFWPLFSRQHPNYNFFGTRSERNNSNFQVHLQNCDFWRPYFEF